MSVLVAALAKTKNFASLGSKSDSKSSKSDKSGKSKDVAKDVAAASGASEAEPSDATASVIAEEEKDSYPEELGYPTELIRSFSKHSVADSETDDESENHTDEYVLGPNNLGPIVPLKDQLERDKEDESLRRWKEQLLGQVRLDSDSVEPEVKFLTLGMTSPGRADIIIPLPLQKDSKGVTFTLKEGSKYRLKFAFEVHNNIVSGLKYIHSVWKGNIQVDHTKVMLGTFSPQVEPYTHIMDEETTPSGVLARGSYTAKSKFVDDDDKCYLEIDYVFEIRKDWTHHQRKWSLGAF
ncbi:hypothetical protein R1sor_020803 [Riccia sorocarpa]|uniref:Rho GDP-dissociation inhibitor 1 n=1 Tax=Riccia sorocarpa TaxID=122646 RepID=A0ABD3GH01_9MARC